MSGKPKNINVSAKRLKNALHVRGYSQEGIANIVNERFSVEGQNFREPRTFQLALQKGRIDPGYLDKICQIIDVDPDYIIEEKFDSYLSLVSELSDLIESDNSKINRNNDFKELFCFDPNGLRILPYDYHDISKKIEKTQGLLIAYLHSEVSPYLPEVDPAFISELGNKVHEFVRKEAIKELKRIEGRKHEKQQ